MKPRSLFALLLVACLSSTAFARGGKLNMPFVGYPSGLPADQQTRAQAAITYLSEELKFLDGSWISVHFTHRFAGTAEQTTKFIALLEKAKAWKVRVYFKDLGEQDSAFSLYQIMGGNELDVTVNSARKEFTLKDFQAYLPKQSGAEK